MRVQLLFFDGCPNWEIAKARILEAGQRLGRSVEVEEVVVGSVEDAERWGFHGSASLLLDGEDPFAEPGAATGLMCRLYRTPEGVGGAPTVAQLVEVLAEAGRLPGP